MRHFFALCLFSLLAVAAATFAVAFLAFEAFCTGAALLAPPRDHFEILPGAPRSIRDTRRMGLA